MSKPLALAVYGVGAIAQPYLAALQARHDVLVIALGDGNAGAAKQAAAPWNARVWTDPVAMLQEEAPEAFLALASAPELGHALEQAAIQRIPFLVEPPGVKDWLAATRLQTLLETHSLLAAMGFPYRSVDIVREAKEFLSTQPLHLARATWLVPSSASPWEMLWNGACPLVDLLRFFLGDIDTVQAMEATNTALLVTLQASHGAIASFVLRSQQLPDVRIELELLGEKWSLLFTERISRLRFTEATKTTILRQTNQPVTDQVAAFLEAVRRQDQQRVICSFAEGRKTLAVCEGVRQALTTRQTVSVAEVLS
jgi:predicted dehydrogenase